MAQAGTASGRGWPPQDDLRLLDRPGVYQLGRVHPYRPPCLTVGSPAATIDLHPRKWRNGRRARLRSVYPKGVGVQIPPSAPRSRSRSLKARGRLLPQMPGARLHCQLTKEGTPEPVRVPGRDRVGRVWFKKLSGGGPVRQGRSPLTGSLWGGGLTWQVKDGESSSAIADLGLPTSHELHELLVQETGEEY